MIAAWLSLPPGLLGIFSFLVWFNDKAPNAGMNRADVVHTLQSPPQFHNKEIIDRICIFYFYFQLSELHIVELKHLPQHLVFLFSSSTDFQQSA